MYFTKGKNTDQKGYILHVSTHITFRKGVKEVTNYKGGHTETFKEMELFYIAQRRWIHDAIMHVLKPTELHNI